MRKAKKEKEKEQAEREKRDAAAAKGKEEGSSAGKPIKRNRSVSLGRKSGKMVEKTSSEPEADKPTPAKKRSLSLIRRPKKMKTTAKKVFGEADGNDVQKEKPKEKEVKESKAGKEKVKKTKRKGSGSSPSATSPTASKRGRAVTTPVTVVGDGGELGDSPSDGEDGEHVEGNGTMNSVQKKQLDPEHFHARLKARGQQPQEMLNTLVELSQRLKDNSSPQWIQTFVLEPLRGVSLLLEILVEKDHRRNKSGIERSIMATALECLRYLLNTQVGIHEVINQTNGTKGIASLLNADDPKISAQVLELLQFVCLVPPKGINLVLDAMTAFKRKKKETARFSTLVTGLRVKEQDMTFLVNCMAFINTLVSTPDDLQVRSELRREFVDMGILDIFASFKEDYETNELITQISVFEEEMKADIEELKRQTGTEIAKVDRNNPKQVFTILDLQARGSAYYDAFVAVMRNFLELTSETPAGLQMWRGMQNVTNKFKLIVDKDGFEEEVEVMLASQFDELKQKHEHEVKNLNRRVRRAQESVMELTEKIRAMKSEGERERHAELKENITRSLGWREQQTQQNSEGGPKNPRHSMHLVGSEEVIKRKSAVHGELLRNNHLKRKSAQMSSDELKRDSLYDDNVGSISLSSGATTTAAAERTPFANIDVVLRKKLSMISSGTPPKHHPANTASKEKAKEATGTTMHAVKPEGIPTLSSDSLPAPLVLGAPEAIAPTAPPPLAPPPLAPPTPPQGMFGAPPPLPVAPLPGKHVLPPKKLIEPKTKMKHFDWVKIPASKVAGSLWGAINDENIELDVEGLESAFCAQKAVNEGKEEEDKSKASGLSIGPRKNFITLINHKRANNIAIVLSQFRVPYSTIRQAILDLDENFLYGDIPTKLVECAPTKEEIEIVSEFHGNKEHLGKAEQFFLEVKDIPSLDVRLRSFAFKIKFQEMVNELRPDITAVIRASEETQESEKLRKMMETLLAIGNYINGGTFRGGAYGFKLECLTKLQNTKSADGKSTLMHYLAAVVANKYPELLTLSKELKHVAAACRVSFTVVKQGISNLKRGFSVMEEGLAGIPVMAGGIDIFKVQMEQFVQQKKAEFLDLESDAVAMEEDFTVAATFFGEPPESSSPEYLFGVFHQFITSFERCHEENVRNKQKMEKEQQQQSGGASKSRKRMPVGTAGIAPNGQIMDDMISQLKAGSYFRQRREMMEKTNQRLDPRLNASAGQSAAKAAEGAPAATTVAAPTTGSGDRPAFFAATPSALLRPAGANKDSPINLVTAPTAQQQRVKRSLTSGTLAATRGAGPGSPMLGSRKPAPENKPSPPEQPASPQLVQLRPAAQRQQAPAQPLSPQQPQHQQQQASSQPQQAQPTTPVLSRGLRPGTRRGSLAGQENAVEGVPVFGKGAAARFLQQLSEREGAEGGGGGENGSVTTGSSDASKSNPSNTQG